MSKELIAAARRGDLDEVKRLEAAGTDMNFVLDESRPNSVRIDRATALSVAILNRKWDVAEFLVKRVSIYPRPKNGEVHTNDEILNNAYLYFCYDPDEKPFNPGLFKLALAKTPDLDPPCRIGISNSLVSYLILGKRDCLLGIILHEAILRNNTAVIKQIDLKFIACTIESMTDFIAGRNVSNQEVVLANRALDDLVLRQKIPGGVAQQLKGLISKQNNEDVKQQKQDEVIATLRAQVEELTTEVKELRAELRASNQRQESADKRMEEMLGKLIAAADEAKKPRKVW